MDKWVTVKHLKFRRMQIVDIVLFKKALQNVGVEVNGFNDGYTVVMYDEGAKNIIGFYTVGIIYQMVYLIHFYIFPAWRHINMARRLIRHFLQTLKIDVFIINLSEQNKYLLRFLIYRFKNVVFFKSINTQSFYIIEV